VAKASPRGGGPYLARHLCHARFARFVLCIASAIISRKGPPVFDVRVKTPCERIGFSEAKKVERTPFLHLSRVHKCPRSSRAMAPIRLIRRREVHPSRMFYAQFILDKKVATKDRQAEPGCVG
jgi:hypothetical protein